MKPTRQPIWAWLIAALLYGLPGNVTAAERYAGNCQVAFAGDSTLHAFTGEIAPVALVVLCETNAAGAKVLNTRIAIGPKQLSTHHEKRDANMHKMFQPDRFPTLLAVVSNAPLAAARLTPTQPAPEPGALPMQLTICGITQEVPAKTSNQKFHPNGWEFDLQADVSLKAFQLKPSSALFGAIRVNDKVAVKAHIVVQKETAE